MSDNKRANLITVESSKKNKGNVRKTIRISLDLFQSNKKECPEFNYKELVKAEEGRRRDEKEKKAASAVNGLRDPFSDNDDDVERIAKQFEQKYGGSSTYGRSKGRCKQDDYADIGAGYDENDSFIDNTDGYDEMIPPECDTVCGGFYINSGSLEFMNVTGVGIAASDNLGGGDSSPPSHRKSHKRALSTSESEEESSSSGEESETSTGEKNTETEGKSKTNGVTDSDKSGEDRKKKSSKSKDDKASRKKRKNSQEESAGSNPETASKKTVKDLLAEARVTVGIENNEASTDSGSSDSNSKPPPPVPASDNQASSDSSREIPALPPVPVSNVPPPPPSVPPIPSTLPPEAAILVRRLKALADAHFSSRTGKLSGSEVNEIILGMEKQCRRGGVSPGLRHTLFGHAALLLRRGKPGLIQRARRLADEKTITVKDPLDRLKGIIETMKPNLLETYRIESQKIIETNRQISAQNATLDDDKKIPEKRLPKRRFPWDDQVRGILTELVKSQSVGVSTDEESIVKFLQTVVLPLFPSGFVRMPTLLQQAKLNKTQKVTGEMKKSQNKAELKQAVNNLHTAPNRPINKQPVTAVDNKPVQPLDRSISDPESMAPVPPRPKTQTSSICIGTDIQDSVSNKRDSATAVRPSPDNGKPFKMLSEGPATAAAQTIGDNVSISVANILHKKSDSEKSSVRSPPKVDRYIPPTNLSSVTITPVSSSPKEPPKAFPQPKTSTANALTFTSNSPPVKPPDAALPMSPSGSPSQSPVAIKVKSSSALFDKSTIAKIISGKGGGPDPPRPPHPHPPQSNLPRDGHGSRPKIPSETSIIKSHEKHQKPPGLDPSPGIISRGDGISSSPILQPVKTSFGSDLKILSVNDAKSSNSNNDLFLKPKHKSDYSPHSSGHRMPGSGSKYDDPSRYHRHNSKSSHGDRDSSNVSPTARYPEKPPSSGSSPYSDNFASSLKHHRIVKTKDSEVVISDSARIIENSASDRDSPNISPAARYSEKPPSSASTPYSDNFAASLKRHRIIKAKETDVVISGSARMIENSVGDRPLNNARPPKFNSTGAVRTHSDDSSSDDCVEIPSDDSPAAAISSLKDDAVRKEAIRRQMEKQYGKLYPTVDRHDKPTKIESKPPIKEAIKKNSYSVHSILKGSNIDSVPASSSILRQNDYDVIPSSLKRMNFAMPDRPEFKKPSSNNISGEEPDAKKSKVDVEIVQQMGHFRDVEGDTKPADRVRAEAVSVIKDNFAIKSDRFKDRAAEKKECAPVSVLRKSVDREMTEQDLDINRVMQDLKELQNLQMRSPDGIHQRLYEDSANS